MLGRHQRIIAILVVAAALIVPHSGFAATPDEALIEELRLKVAEYQKTIDEKLSLIATTREQEDSLKKEIAMLKNQIASVQARINATQAKIELTVAEIDSVQDEIGQKRAEISRKRETIGRLVFFLDQRDQESLLASLFKYTKLSDFVAQVHDLANVQNRIMAMIAEIKQEKAALEADKNELEVKQQELEDLNEEAALRQQQLFGVKGQRDQVLKITMGKEALYKKEVAEMEKQKAALFKELRELELKVISGGLYIVHVKATSIPPKGTKLFTLPEDNGHLTQSYGWTTYAKRGNYGGAPHNGVDYASGYGAPIKAIGAGQIVANGTNPGWGNWIAIQHENNMVSVYGHMSSFAPLKVGAQVSQGQVIGYEGNTGNTSGKRTANPFDGSHIHLSLYTEFFTYLKGDDLYFNYFEGSVNPLNYM